MSSFLFPAFYRKYGILNSMALAEPKRSSIQNLELPRSSILHYWPESVNSIGPEVDYLLFRNIKRPIFMGHITEIGDNLGTPRLLATPIEPEIRAYHNARRRYRRLNDPSFMGRDAASLYVATYGSIQKRYRYNRGNIFAPYYRWHNAQAALWKNVNELANLLPNRNQFVFIDLPALLPGLSDLLRHEVNFTQQTLARFDSSEKLMILHLWRWMTDNRELSLLSAIEAKNLSRVNLVFRDSGRWSLLNLGRLSSFRSSTEKEIALVEKMLEESNGDEAVALENQLKTMKQGKGLPANTVARFLLRGLVSITNSRNKQIVLDEVEPESDDLAPETSRLMRSRPAEDDTGSQDDTVTIEIGAPGTNNKAVKEEAPRVTVITDDDDDDELDEGTDAGDPNDIMLDDEGDISPEDLLDMEKEVEADLERLDEINERAQAGEEVGQNITEGIVGKEPAPLDESLMEVADLYADSGMLSASAHRRFQRLSETYKDIEMPDGTRLDEFVVIPEESLALTETAKGDSPQPPPEGMPNPKAAGSTLNAFDRQYVDDVLERDVAAMVLSIQRAGFAVLDYTSTTVRTIQGDYRQYSVRVVGVDGTATTLNFRLPVIDRNGEFRVNNVNYRLAKQQQFHMPIKKIAPRRVSLTTYYGKLFVEKPQLRAANFDRWLVNAIRARVIDEDAAVKITDLAIVDVYTSAPVLPRSYTALAQNFLSFKVSTPEGFDWSLYFDYDKRKEFFLGDATKEFTTAEANNTVVIGADFKKGVFLVMDYNSNIFIHEKSGELRPVGPIEKFLDLNTRTMPVEYSSVDIMGKPISVGLILGFLNGISRLINELKPTVRRVPAGQRINLLPEEYAIAFSDQTLVFARGNTVSNLIFGGLIKYRDSIRHYAFNDFDSPEVYLNVMEESGLRATIANEFTLLRRMFIDPVSEELLKQMGEPTVFDWLLIRATEMLLTDHIPKVKDRVRGYERFAGAVYTEIVKSLRMHAIQSARGNKSFDFNPFAVQRAIMDDTSKMQVKDINPIEDLKQQELMKTTGTGGRSSLTMTKDTRRYDPLHEGLNSESTPDSATVAINSNTSANPKINSVRGTYDNFDHNEDDPSRLVSTSSVLSPGADKED